VGRHNPDLGLGWRFNVRRISDSGIGKDYKE